MTIPRDIFVRMYGGTYIARCMGKTASCTAGEKPAAEAVARKVAKAYGDPLISVQQISSAHFIGNFRGAANNLSGLKTEH